MKQPKYRIGDTVWWVNSQIESGIITGIVHLTRTKHTGTFRPKQQKYPIIKYFVGEVEDVNQYGWKQEELLFYSRQELVDSLLNPAPEVK